jgi:hypothetical protein
MTKIEQATREAARLRDEKRQAMTPHDQRMGDLIDQYNAIRDVRRVLERYPLLVEMSETARAWACSGFAGEWPGEFHAARSLAIGECPSNPRLSAWWQE